MSAELPKQNEAMRLQKFLARAGVASRRSSEKVIAAGRVQVNGTVVTEMGTKVDPSVDQVFLDGQLVELPAQATTIMLNKPAGYLTSMSDPRGRPCVASLVPAEKYPGLYPIGRLDFDTTGLLLFSTDGELGHALLHPSHHVSKTYRALVKGVPGDSALQALEQGVLLEDGRTAPAQAKIAHKKKGNAVLLLTIHEGKKRQVKRMCEAVGHPVLQLHRVKFGPIELGKLAEGEWRVLSDEEVRALTASPKQA
jgi:23S rRNA pseudouridine2605 synthase